MFERRGVGKKLVALAALLRMCSVLPVCQREHLAHPEIILTVAVLISGTKQQSWALALFFQVRSRLNFYPWIAIALPLILRIFRFAHRSIALEQTSGSLLEKSSKNSIRSFSFDIGILL